MAKFRISKRARIDIDKIWEYTYHKWSMSQADKYFKELQKQFIKISKDPKIGKNYDHVKKNYQGCIYKSHIIFYKVDRLGEIEIVRILHGRMDLINRIEE